MTCNFDFTLDQVRIILLGLNSVDQTAAWYGLSDEIYKQHEILIASFEYAEEVLKSDPKNIIKK